MSHDPDPFPGDRLSTLLHERAGSVRPQLAPTSHIVARSRRLRRRRNTMTGGAAVLASVGLGALVARPGATTSEVVPAGQASAVPTATAATNPPAAPAVQLGLALEGMDLDRRWHARGEHSLISLAGLVAIAPDDGGDATPFETAATLDPLARNGVSSIASSAASVYKAPGQTSGLPWVAVATTVYLGPAPAVPDGTEALTIRGHSATLIPHPGENGESGYAIVWHEDERTEGFISVFGPTGTLPDPAVVAAAVIEERLDPAAAAEPSFDEPPTPTP